MKSKEARQILEVSETSTKEEIKKQYKSLVKIWHPDINKDPEAEAKFKKINEAYDHLSSDKPEQDDFWGNPFGRQNIVQIENIDLYTTISFKESVQGCKRDLKFNRKCKCKNCHGQGQIAKNNGCAKCKGRGTIISQQGNMIMTRTCDKCYGRSSTESCKTCNADGFLESEVSINVSIPGGIFNQNVLRLGGMGHFIGYFGPLEQNTDAHLHITVTPEEGLSLEGLHVISNLELSLLDAIKGSKKTIKTINGDKEIEVKPMSRNKDEIIIPNLGVNSVGNQRVILDVRYPEDINKLLSNLETEAK